MQIIHTTAIKPGDVIHPVLLKGEDYRLDKYVYFYSQFSGTFMDGTALTKQQMLNVGMKDDWEYVVKTPYKAKITQGSSKNYQNPNYTKAVQAYSESVKTLQLMRSDLASINPEVQAAFQAGVEPIHRELVSLLLADTTVPTENLEKARTVMESLQLAELDNFFREACLSANPVLIDQVDRQAAVVYPIILPDRLDIIVRLPGQALRRRFPYFGADPWLRASTA